MSSRVDTTKPSFVDVQEDDRRTSETDRPSAANHLLAIGVVILLFGSLLGPVSHPGVIAAAAVIIGVATLRSLSRHSAIAARTVLLAFVIAGVVGLRAFYDPPVGDYGQTKWINFCTLTLATMIAASAVFTRRTVKALAFWWVLTGVVLAALALLGPGAATGRAEVEGSNPVWLGRAIAASLVMLVWLGVNNISRWWRVLLLGALLVVGLLATGSRGPTVAALIGVVVLFLAPTAKRSRQVLWLLVGGVLIFVFAPLIPALTESRFGRFLAEGDVSGESRTTLLSTSLRAIPELPFGAGIGGWSEATGISRHLWPHNLFVEVFVEQGWLVGVVLIGLVVEVGRRAWRASGNDPALQLGVALLATETVHVSTSGDLNARTFFFVLLFNVALLLKQRFEAVSQAAPAPRQSASVRRSGARGPR